MTPANESALYDLMQERFGIGDYDEANPDRPWWRARGTEIAKLKAQMRRRRLSIEDLTIAVEYASETSRPISGVWQLCDLVGVAKKHQRAMEQEAARHEAIRECWAAAREAYEMGEDAWGDRLYAADAASRADVLDQWTKHKEAR